MVDAVAESATREEARGLVLDATTDKLRSRFRLRLLIRWRSSSYTSST
jgi:hypothetical protein